jgi:hypothetical protein
MFWYGDCVRISDSRALIVIRETHDGQIQESFISHELSKTKIWMKLATSTLLVSLGAGLLLMAVQDPI